MARISRRYAAALLTGACAVLLGACSPSGGSDRPTAENTGSPSSLAQQTDDGGPVTSTRSSTTATSATSSTPTSATSSTPTTTTNVLPGGTGPTAALAEAGYLRDGRIVLDALREAAAAPDDDTGSTDGVAYTAGQPATDLCDFLFGTAEEVAALTRVAAGVHLSPLSGPHLTADLTGADDAPAGLVVACVYADDAAPQVVLQVGAGAPVDTDLPGQPVIVDGDGIQAVLSYAPDHAGPRIDQRTARDWLISALARVTTGD